MTLVQEHAVAVVGDPSRPPLGVVDAGCLDHAPRDRHEARMPRGHGVGVGQRQGEPGAREVGLIPGEDREVAREPIRECIGADRRAVRSPIGSPELEVAFLQAVDGRLDERGPRAEVVRRGARPANRMPRRRRGA